MINPSSSLFSDYPRTTSSFAVQLGKALSTKAGSDETDGQPRLVRVHKGAAEGLVEVLGEGVGLAPAEQVGLPE